MGIAVRSPAPHSCSLTSRASRSVAACQWPAGNPIARSPKDRLHLLFVVSRPEDANLIDPRADPMAVMDAIDAEAPGRVSFEFLRPPTLRRLLARLRDKQLPPIDILHFDGHGAYDPDGWLSERSRQAMVAAGAAGLMRRRAGGGRQHRLSTVRGRRRANRACFRVEASATCCKASGSGSSSCPPASRPWSAAKMRWAASRRG